MEASEFGPRLQAQAYEVGSCVPAENGCITHAQSPSVNIAELPSILSQTLSFKDIIEMVQPHSCLCASESPFHRENSAGTIIP